MHQPFTPDDILHYHSITAIDLAPGGDRVACCVRSVDRDEGQDISRIWVFPVGGGEGELFTQGPGSDTTPRWSPDGERLAFIASRGGGASQVHLIERNGGEARKVSDLAGGASDVAWMPDGRSLLVASGVPVDPDLRGARPAQPAKQADRKQDPLRPEVHVAYKLPYKSDGTGYLLGREIHLFRVEAQGGETKQLTDGPFDVLGYAPSPNGKHIAYTRTREGRFAHCSDLWVCDADGSHTRRLTRELAMVGQPAWSPDGRWIAFAGAREEGDARERLWLFDFASGRLQQLGGDEVLVAEAESIWWEPDGSSLRFVEAWRGRQRVSRIAIGDGAIEPLVQGDRQVRSLSCSATHMAFTVDHPALPSELSIVRGDGSGEQVVSDFNPWWRERTPLTAELRRFDVPDGLGGTETIEGWLIGPEQAATGCRPLLDDAHGGPASHALLDYPSSPYWPVLCSQGWQVLALNAVGSWSYGPEFAERLAGRWGELDLPQHLAAIRQLQAEGVCDDRLAICGSSYGGYLSGWAASHTDLFRAVVVMAPVGNIEVHYGVSDSGYYSDPYSMGTDGRFDRRLARQLSPLHHIDRTRSPTLFLQGKDDERCPRCQSEELFVNLMRSGDTPAELVLYPGEGHHFLAGGAPGVRIDATRRVIEWLRRYIGQAGKPRDPERADQANESQAAG